MLHVYVTANAGSKWTFNAPPHFEIACFFGTVPVFILSTLQGKGCSWWKRTENLQHESETTGARLRAKVCNSTRDRGNRRKIMCCGRHDANF